MVPKGLFIHLSIIYTWSAFKKKKKYMMPSGNLRLSQETLTRTHYSTGYKKQGHLPNDCLHCPSYYNCSHNCGTCPRGSRFHSSALFLSSQLSQILLLGTATESSLGSGLQVLKQKQKGSVQFSRSLKLLHDELSHISMFLQLKTQ